MAEFCERKWLQAWPRKLTPQWRDTIVRVLCLLWNPRTIIFLSYDGLVLKDIERVVLVGEISFWHSHALLLTLYLLFVAHLTPFVESWKIKKEIKCYLINLFYDVKGHMLSLLIGGCSNWKFFIVNLMLNSYNLYINLNYTNSRFLN